MYRHVRLDKNVPFYVGIGTIKRPYSKKGRNKYWNNIVKFNEGVYEVDILFEDLSWEHASEKEIEFISLYGRKDLKEGTLCNLTNGGDGSGGLLVSDFTKKKHSESWHSISEERKLEIKLKISNSVNANYNSVPTEIKKERQNKRNESLKQYWNEISENDLQEHKERASNARKNIPLEKQLEMNRKVSETLLNKSKEEKAEISFRISNILKNKTPEQKAEIKRKIDLTKSKRTEEQDVERRKRVAATWAKKSLEKSQLLSYRDE